MQINIRDEEILAPVYFCGKRGEPIDVQVHGVNYTVWKLLDNLETHVGKKGKISCKTCHNRIDKSGAEKLIESMLDLGKAAKDATVKFVEAKEVFKTKLEEGTT